MSTIVNVDTDTHETLQTTDTANTIHAYHTQISLMIKVFNKADVFTTNILNTSIVNYQLDA